VRGAQISELGRPPEPAELPEPVPGDGEAVVEVLAVPLNPIDVAVGTGRHYAGHPELPYVPGCEAVGRKDGALVWVHGAGIGTKRGGTLAERVAAPREALVEVPEGADPAVAAALGIAGLAGWMPLAWRAPVREGDRVLVLGATGAVGSIAVQAAKLLGAARVVAAGRDREALERALELGADEAVELDGDFGEPTYVFDPLWGEPAEQAILAAAPGARIVQLGQSAGAEATLASATVRGKQLEILGYSNFAVPRDVLEREYRRLVEHAVRGEIRVDVERVPLERIAEAWERQAASPNRKLVVEPAK
jgi:NADPH2:quinone reductase